MNDDKKPTSQPSEQTPQSTPAPKPLERPDTSESSYFTRSFDGENLSTKNTNDIGNRD